MGMPYPNSKTYAKVYARYLQGGRTAQMLALAGELKGKKVADLCAGGGRLTRMALEAGAEVTMIDESIDMMSDAPREASQHVSPIAKWLRNFGLVQRYDALFCQQGINYWLDESVAKALRHVVVPDGVFVFNTFNTKPSPEPTLKHYELDGVKFVEASWLSAGDNVEHVQMRAGEPPHTTRFRWIAPEMFRAWLSPWFELEEIIEGPSTVWVCKRKHPSE